MLGSQVLSSCSSASQRTIQTKPPLLNSSQKCFTLMVCYFFGSFLFNVLISVNFAVYADGAICLDILQNQWSPIYDIAAILTSIQV